MFKLFSLIIASLINIVTIQAMEEDKNTEVKRQWTQSFNLKDGSKINHTAYGVTYFPLSKAEISSWPIRLAESIPNLNSHRMEVDEGTRVMISPPPTITLKATMIPEEIFETLVAHDLYGRTSPPIERVLDTDVSDWLKAVTLKDCSRLMLTSTHIIRWYCSGPAESIGLPPFGDPSGR